MRKAPCSTATEEFSGKKLNTMFDDPIGPFRASAAISKSPSSLHLLIRQVLSQPKIYAGFAELLHMPNVVNLLGIEDPSLKTLELFSYGIYEDYVKSEKGTYIS